MISKFMLRATFFSVLSVSLFNTWVYQNRSRELASQDKQLELHIKQMMVDDGAAPHRVKGKFFLRVTFSDSYVFEFGKNENLTVQRGVAVPLDYKLDVNHAWVREGQLPFKVELVSSEGFEKTIVKCEQLPQGVFDYNRSFQCFLPMQKQSFLTYRLGDKFSKPEEPSKLVQVR
ncbi:MAG TPA: hypothetical protein VM901_05405 [Bdellovibrionota bacterium]|nr:hypothetical protein [Bdellovibrionota bacterium]